MKEREIADWKARKNCQDSSLRFFPQGTLDKKPEPGDKWQITKYLSSCKAKWAKELIKIYNHPMSFPASISPHAGELLRSLISNIAPKNIMETGTYMGVSSIWIASGMIEYSNHNKLHCVDLFNPISDNPWCPGVSLNDPHEFASKHIRRAGFGDTIELHRGNSRIIAPKVAESIGGPIDFALIDGVHTIEGVEEEFLLIEPYISTGGYILLHDVFPNNCGWDGPAHILDNVIVGSNRFELCNIYTAPLNFGYALIRKTL